MHPLFSIWRESDLEMSSSSSSGGKRTENPVCSLAINSLFDLNAVEEDVAVLEEAVEDAVADLHGGAEDDGDVLERHLVEGGPLHDVHHVHEDPLQQQPVALGQLRQQGLHPLDALARSRIRGYLLEPK